MSSKLKNMSQTALNTFAREINNGWSYECQPMTKQQIAAAYIEAAEKAILKSKEMDLIRFYDYLLDEYLQCGICFYIGSKYNINIYGSEYMGNNQWFTQPSPWHTVPEMIECLQYRVNILKTWL